MALTRYRSFVPITTQARKDAAYEKVTDLFAHARPLGYDVLRVEYNASTQYIEVDVTNAIPKEPIDQVTHLGLQGPL